MVGGKGEGEDGKVTFDIVMLWRLKLVLLTYFY